MAGGNQKRKRPAEQGGAAAKRAARQGASFLQPAPEENAGIEVDLAGEPQVQEAAIADPDAGNRRDGMAEIARRRAAHFAHYQADDGEEEAGPSNLHAGGTEARNLGPWSSARQLVEARAAAAAARTDKILDTARAAEPEDTVRWTPARDVKQGERPAYRVMPLQHACVELLVEYIEDVESLWGLPDSIKVRLAAAVCHQRKLEPEVVHLFTEGAPTEVCLPGCTALDQDALSAALTDCATPKLEQLELRFCGRGMGDAAAAALASNGPLPGLQRLTLGGAYRLTDKGLEQILAVTPNLTVLQLPQCSRLTGAAIERLPALCPHLRELDLDECRGISAASLQRIFTARLASLSSLCLNGIAEVSDQLLTEAALSVPLRQLSICHCPAVTDAGLRGLAAGRPQLEGLALDDVGKVTGAGLEALAESCRSLQVLSLKRCQRVTDASIAAVASRGALRTLRVNSVPHVGLATIKALAKHCRDHLEELDVSWCRNVPSAALGMLADSCPLLQTLHVWGCSQVTRQFLHGHSNDSLRVVGSTLQSAPELAHARLALIGA
ncbi:hypothetical protein WJX72_002569 [[Myrmecia] bisecta]|uniref:F-box/LRR-repeat protein 15-like leucin rich repeat domain-containing protein n=1 Tax=[Myrmecia] bisecta TaxID=41462 RepID=A0AAW1PU17_9CHLO